MRYKTIEFSFTIPITSIKKDNSLFSVGQSGELRVTAKATILKEPENDLPPQFQEKNEEWYKIALSSVRLINPNDDGPGAEISALSALPDAKPLFTMISRAAANNLHTIYWQSKK